MSKFDAFLHNDNRVATQLMRAGLLSHDDVAKQTKQLPDDAGNAEYIPAYEEPIAEEAPTFEAV